MTAALITPPSSEPVSLAEAKAHLRLDGDAEDDLVETLVVAARRHVELETRRVLVEQGWRIYFDRWSADGCLSLPVAPLLSLDAVTLYDREGGPSSLDLSAFDVDTVSVPPRAALRTGLAVMAPGRPLNGIELDVTAGYGAAADVPAPLRQAILMLVAHWFEHREAVGDGLSLVPLGVAALLAPYRIHRL